MQEHQIKEFIDSFPDRVERGLDGVDISRLEPGTGFVYTGLGGVGQKLRYIVIIAVLQPPLDAAVQPSLESHWEQSAHTHNSDVEAIVVADEYIQVTLLIPMDVAPDDVIQAGLRWQWKSQPVLDSYYFITNVGVPTAEDIAEWLEEVRVALSDAGNATTD